MIADPGQGTPALVRALFRWNAIGYTTVGALLLIVNITAGGGAWSFWPLFVWGVILALHFFVTKSLEIDDGWVAERADDLRYRSYDQGHIHDIEHRVDERDASVRPADERE